MTHLCRKILQITAIKTISEKNNLDEKKVKNEKNKISEKKKHFFHMKKKNAVRKKRFF